MPTPWWRTTVSPAAAGTGPFVPPADPDARARRRRRTPGRRSGRAPAPRRSAARPAPASSAAASSRLARLRRARPTATAGSRGGATLPAAAAPRAGRARDIVRQRAPAPASRVPRQTQTRFPRSPSPWWSESAGIQRQRMSVRTRPGCRRRSAAPATARASAARAACRSGRALHCRRRLPAGCRSRSATECSRPVRRTLRSTGAWCIRTGGSARAAPRRPRGGCR